MRPILLGMNNPLSPDPRYALFPHPPGCAGHRLYRMLEAASGASRSTYLTKFERRNLVPTQTWIASEAREAAAKMIPELEGRRVVLLGRELAEAFGLKKVLLEPLVEDVMVDMFSNRTIRITFYQVPHPSGRNTWYNTAANRRSVGELLAKLIEEELS